MLKWWSEKSQERGGENTEAAEGRARVDANEEVEVNLKEISVLFEEDGADRDEEKVAAEKIEASVGIEEESAATKEQLRLWMSSKRKL